MNNERYDETNRWKGGINFAGEVFPKMRNWTANNRATSVGNQLHCNYRKFLLAYELAHRAQDLGMDDAPPLPGAALKVRSCVWFWAVGARGQGDEGMDGCLLGACV